MNQPQQQKKRATIGIRDSFRICQYLTKTPPQAGESWIDVYTRIQSELSSDPIGPVPGLNWEHIRNRSEELGLPLVPGVTAKGDLTIVFDELAEIRDRLNGATAAHLSVLSSISELVERMTRVESAVAAHKLAIQGIGRDNVGAMNALNGIKFGSIQD